MTVWRAPSRERERHSRLCGAVFRSVEGSGGDSCCSGSAGGGGGAGIGGAIFDASGGLVLSDTELVDNEVLGGIGGTDGFGNPGNSGGAVSADVHVFTR